MRSMMKRDSISHFAVLALIAGSLVFAAIPARAQDVAPSSADLAKRIDDLEKQLADLKAQVSAPAPAPAPVAATAAVSTPAPAAPAAPTLSGLLGPVTLSGFVDTYYGYNSNQPGNRTTALHNFDVNSSQFSLNMIELVADKPADPAATKIGYHIALGFGQAMNLINGGEGASPNVPIAAIPGVPGYATAPPGTISNFDQYLKEGYLEYAVNKKLQINVGRFVTPAGAEVIESKDNWNYTRGLLFSWAIPYFHFGASAKYAFNSKFALTGYLVNGWNNSVENNSGKTTGFTAAWTPSSKFSLFENYLVGPEQFNNNGNYRHLTDTVMTFSPNAKLSFMANFDYGHDEVLGLVNPTTSSPVWWSGIAGYIKYAPNDKWYVATRGEWFNDHNGFNTAVPQQVEEFTLTLQRMLASKLMSRLEYRYDTSNRAVFAYHNDLPRSSQNTVTVGLIYAFSSADAK